MSEQDVLPIDEKRIVSNKPNFIAYGVRGEGNFTRWKSYGVVFKNKKEGYTVLLDGVPLNGKLVLLPSKDDVVEDKQHSDEEINQKLV